MKLVRILLILLILSLIGNIYLIFKAWDYRAHVNVFLDKYISAVDDMARREVYREENIPLRSDRTVSGRVVFFGTQLIAGWPLRDNFTEGEMINRGVDGQRAAGLLLRVYPDLIDLSPECALVQISSYNFRPQNDRRNIMEYTRELLQTIRSNDILPIAATVVTPGKDILEIDTEIIPDNYKIRDTIALFNENLRKYCFDNQIDLIDFDALLAGPDRYMNPDLSGTSIIPNDSGYKLLSAEIKNVIRRMTKPRQ